MITARGTAYTARMLNKLYANSWLGVGKKLKVTHWVNHSKLGCLSTRNITLCKYTTNGNLLAVVVYLMTIFSADRLGAYCTGTYLVLFDIITNIELASFTGATDRILHWK